MYAISYSKLVTDWRQMSACKTALEEVRQRGTDRRVVAAVNYAAWQGLDEPLSSPSPSTSPTLFPSRSPVSPASNSSSAPTAPSPWAG